MARVLEYQEAKPTSGDEMMAIVDKRNWRPADNDRLIFAGAPLFAGFVEQEGRSERVREPNRDS